MAAISIIVVILGGILGYKFTRREGDNNPFAISYVAMGGMYGFLLTQIICYLVKQSCG